MDRMRSLICGLHKPGAAAADDIATHLGQFGGEFFDCVVSGCGRFESRGAEDCHPIILPRSAAKPRQFVNDLPQAGDCAFNKSGDRIFIVEANDVGLSKGSLFFAHIVLGKIGM